MSDTNIKFIYQVGEASEQSVLEKRLKPLLDNYSLSGQGKILVSPVTEDNVLLISPRNVRYEDSETQGRRRDEWEGKITEVNLKKNGTGGLLHKATPEYVEFSIRNGEISERYVIEYFLDKEYTEKYRGLVLGDPVGSQSIGSNLDAAVLKLSKASCRGIEVEVSPGYKLSTHFASN